MQFYSHSGIHTLQTETVINRSMKEVWSFFSDPANLVIITPPHMKFKITSPPPIRNEVYEGMVITYEVSPVKGMRANWVTEITKVEPQNFFIDEQRFGPYAMWHHEHHFKQLPEGVKMIDKVSYKMPLGPLGQVAQTLFVKRQLKQIFSYRENVLSTIFT